MRFKSHSYPTAGDVVELTGPWSIAEKGQFGVIGGIVGSEMETLHVCFGFRAFRGWSMWGCPEYDRRSSHPHLPGDVPVTVSASGGPATIALPTRLLTPTGDFRITRFWAWADAPRAHGGFDYLLEVPIWRWDGKGY